LIIVAVVFAIRVNYKFSKIATKRNTRYCLKPV